MPITVNWDDDAQTRIYYQFSKSWTWDEFNTVYRDVYAMLDTVSHDVDAIVDLTQSNLLPNDTLSEMRRLTFQQHDNGGITVFITDNRFAHTLYSILTGVLREAKAIFRIAYSYEEAFNIIAEYRENFVTQ